jgi:hypothetical protein
MNRKRLRLHCAPPSHFEGLALRLAGGGGGGAAPQPLGFSPRNLACLQALRVVAAALFLAGTLGSDWFAVLGAHQKCRLRSYHAVLPRLVRRPLVSAQLLVRRASVIEHRLKRRRNSNNRGTRR